MRSTLGLSNALPLRDLTRVPEVAQRLEAGGLSVEASLWQAETIAKCAAELLRIGEPADRGAMALHVPGRIEVLGKHTDYCGGRSLLVATERGFAFVAVARRDGMVGIADVLRGERDLFPIDARLEASVGHWSNYPRTVARRLARNFPGTFGGARIAFGSTLPPAAGLSTSSAFMVGVFLLMAGLEDLAARDAYRANLADIEALASYVATIENGASFGTLAGDSGVGTHGGSEDHTAILASSPGELALYAFAPVRLERRVPFPRGHVFVVATSGIAAEKTGGALALYNRASRLARAVVEAWNRSKGSAHPHLAAIMAAILAESRGADGELMAATGDASGDVVPGSAQRSGDLVAGSPGAIADLLATIERAGHPEFEGRELAERLLHFQEESERIIPEAVRCLESGDLAGFGIAVDRSQESGARLLHNQVPETETLASEARRLGAGAASAFGAGFGGSVWALVPETGAQAFLARWAASYREAFPGRAGTASFFATRAAPAAFAL